MAGSRREWDAEQDGRLAAEVARVCVDGIAAYRNERRWAAIPQLTEIVTHLYATQSMQVLDRLVSQAIETLELEREQDAARVHFGLAGTTSFDLNHVVRESKAAEKLGKAATTYRQKPGYQRSIIVRLGRAIEAMADLGPRGGSAKSNTGIGHDYVRRTEVEAELRRATRQPGVVLLYGDAGTGKTTLAQQHIAQVAPAAQVMVRVHNESRLILDIRLELARFGIHTEDLSDSATKLKFRELLESRRAAPIYVLLDSVDDEEVIEPLIPTQCQSRVLVTSRRRLNLELIAETMLIGAMHADEATQLALQSVPGLSKRDAVGLAHSLGGHPLGIKAACGLLRSTEDTPTAETVKTIVRTPSVTLLTRASDTEANLLAVYEQLLRRFQRSRTYETAIAMLEAICCLASVDIPRSLLANYIAHRQCEAYSPLHSAACVRALDLLCEHSLISQDNNTVSAHPLSQAVWRTIFRDRLRTICMSLDWLMRGLALREVATISWMQLDPSEDEDSQLAAFSDRQSRAKLLWDSHHYALLTAAQGYVSPEELDFDGGCGSRAGNLIKLNLFAGLTAPSAKTVFGASMRTSYTRHLSYFGIEEQELSRLLLNYDD